jgi:hypothetical protein
MEHDPLRNSDDALLGFIECGKLRHYGIIVVRHIICGFRLCRMNVVGRWSWSADCRGLEFLSNRECKGCFKCSDVETQNYRELINKPLTSVYRRIKQEVIRS